MKNRIDFSSLEEYLSLDINPKQLAKLLDELAYEYARQTIRLIELEKPHELYIHPEVTSFIWHLKLLREALRGCKT
ncbi:MAG: hypothetical protein LUG18_12050 [Candidatus Azobacteroides sp.]|nr:hypothetical protein [Candidatus Azobacteroides sp.]